SHVANDNVSLKNEAEHVLADAPGFHNVDSRPPVEPDSGERGPDERFVDCVEIDLAFRRVVFLVLSLLFPEWTNDKCALHEFLPDLPTRLAGTQSIHLLVGPTERRCGSYTTSIPA